MPRTIMVPISRFASCIGFCQHQVINFFHLGLKPRFTPTQKTGLEVHKRLEEEDKLIPRKEASKEELMDPMIDLDIAREAITVSIKRENQNKFLYMGRTDKIIRKGGNVYIIDDKVSPGEPREEPWPDRLIQLSSYCEGFLNNYSNLLKFNKVFLKVIQRNPGGEVVSEYEREYNQEMKDFLYQQFKIFEGLYNKTLNPEHHNNPNRCRSCTFECKWRLQ